MSMVPQSDRSHPRSAHLRTPAEFDRCFRAGRRSGSRSFGYAFRRHDQDDAARGVARARLGLAISRRVDKRAVERNRLRRLVREWFRHNHGLLPPGDLVVSGKPAARGLSAAQIFIELDQLPKRLGLPLTGAPGKMADSTAPDHPDRAPGSPGPQ